MNNIQKEIDQYYQRVGIAPLGGYGYEKYKKKYHKKETPEEREEIIRELYIARYDEFTCETKKDCRCTCYKASNRAENFLFSPHTDGIQVSQYYKDREYKGDHIPRIVVVSLSAPQPGDPFVENSSSQGEKMTLHWQETLPMVRSLLHHFIAPENFPKPIPNPIMSEDEKENKKIIEDLFVHVRTAKCCSNAGGGGQEHSKVYANCGVYLGEELRILEPDVIVTQGDFAHREAEKHVFENAKKTLADDVAGIVKVEGSKHDIARKVKLKKNNRNVYWLRTFFPTQNKFNHLGRKFYPQAGPEIDSERGKGGAMRKNFVRYGEEIKKFMDEQGR